MPPHSFSSNNLAPRYDGSRDTSRIGYIIIGLALPIMFIIGAICCWIQCRSHKRRRYMPRISPPLHAVRLTNRRGAAPIRYSSINLPGLGIQSIADSTQDNGPPERRPIPSVKVSEWDSRQSEGDLDLFKSRISKDDSSSDSTVLVHTLNAGTSHQARPLSMPTAPGYFGTAMLRSSSIGSVRRYSQVVSGSPLSDSGGPRISFSMSGPPPPPRNSRHSFVDSSTIRGHSQANDFCSPSLPDDLECLGGRVEKRLAPRKGSPLGSSSSFPTQEHLSIPTSPMVVSPWSPDGTSPWSGSEQLNTPSDMLSPAPLLKTKTGSKDAAIDTHRSSGIWQRIVQKFGVKESVGDQDIHLGVLERPPRLYSAPTTPIMLGPLEGFPARRSLQHVVLSPKA